MNARSLRPGPSGPAADRASPMRKGLFFPVPGPLRGRGQRRRAGRGEWSCPGPAWPCCPPRSRAGSASGGRSGLVQAPRSGLWFGKKRLSLRQERSQRSPLPLPRPGGGGTSNARAPGPPRPPQTTPSSAPAAHWRGPEPAHPDSGLPSAGCARSPSCGGRWRPTLEPRRREPAPPPGAGATRGSRPAEGGQQWPAIPEPPTPHGRPVSAGGPRPE